MKYYQDHLSTDGCKVWHICKFVLTIDIFFLFSKHVVKSLDENIAKIYLPDCHFYLTQAV